MRGISSPAEHLLASQEGLCFVEVEFKTVPRGSEPHLHPIQWVQGREIHHFPSSGAEVKNELPLWRGQGQLYLSDSFSNAESIV
jgi:hypothetical protein